MKRSNAKKYHQGNGRLNVMRRQLAINGHESNVLPKRLRYRGIAFVWTALVIFVLFLFVGLSIDWAKLLYNLHELQNAADASSLAGAQIVKVSPPDETRDRAQELASDNTAERLDVYLRTTAQADPFVEDPSVDIILGRWINNQHYFFPTLDAPDAVKVIARREEGLTNAPALSFLYGPLVNVTKADAHRVSIAWYNETSGAGLIVLDPYEELGLYILGTGDVRVIDGTIHVNSTATGTKDNPQSPAAVYVQGEGHMLSGRLTLQGRTDPAPPIEDDLNGWDNIWFDDTLAVPMEMPYDIWEGAPYMPDPLRDLVPPDYSESGVNTYSYNETTDGTTTLNPGYYPDGIELSQTGTTVTLNPGTYIIGGGNENKDSGLIINGGNLIGHGVLLYLTKDYIHTDGRWAQLDLGGNGVIDIFPPGDLPENYVNGKRVIDGLLGVSIWQDRADTENTSYLRGGGDMMISGTLYFPNNPVNLAGQPGKAGNQILCWTAQVAGTAPIVVEYDGRNNLHNGFPVLVK